MKKLHPEFIKGMMRAEKFIREATESGYDEPVYLAVANIRKFLFQRGVGRTVPLSKVITKKNKT